jgi:hypothetical protein
LEPALGRVKLKRFRLHGVHHVPHADTVEKLTEARVGVEGSRLGLAADLLQVDKLVTSRCAWT